MARGRRSAAAQTRRHSRLTRLAATPGPRAPAACPKPAARTAWATQERTADRFLVVQRRPHRMCPVAASAARRPRPLWARFARCAPGAGPSRYASRGQRLRRQRAGRRGACRRRSPPAQQTPQERLTAVAAMHPAPVRWVAGRSWPPMAPRAPRHASCCSIRRKTVDPWTRSQAPPFCRIPPGSTSRLLESVNITVAERLPTTEFNRPRR